MNFIAYSGVPKNFEPPFKFPDNPKYSVGVFFTDDWNTASFFSDSSGKNINVVEAELTFDNPLIVDAQYHYYLEIPTPKIMTRFCTISEVDTDLIAEFAFRSRKYDSAIIKNVIEGHQDFENPCTVYIALYPYQVKNIEILKNTNQNKQIFESIIAESRQEQLFKKIIANSKNKKIFESILREERERLQEMATVTAKAFAEIFAIEFERRIFSLNTKVAISQEQAQNISNMVIHIIITDNNTESSPFAIKNISTEMKNNKKVTINELLAYSRNYGLYLKKVYKNEPLKVYKIKIANENDIRQWTKYMIKEGTKKLNSSIGWLRSLETYQKQIEDTFFEIYKSLAPPKNL
jgi:hypothetical protein